MAAPGSDRISLLPDSLIENILVRLPLQEVVGTSVLSKRWISLWTQLPKLNFDSSFCTESVRNDKDRLKQIIENILSHSRKPILQFSFSLDGLSSSGIDQLVNYVCDNGVKYFKLAIPNSELYELRSLAQLCSVKHLTLESCRVKVPFEFECFTMLTYMDFFNVKIEGDELSSLTSSCPLLQTLTLKNLQNCCYLCLDAPNLRVFRSEGFFLSLWLQYAPLLEKMSVKVYDTEYPMEEVSVGEVDFIVPFSVIPALKAMTLDGSFLKYMNAEQKIERCRDVLNNLTFIKLTAVPFELVEVSRNVLSLIRRSPNLEKLVVMTCTEHSASDPGVGVWETENLSDISLNRLQRVIVFNVTSKRSELLFIGTLLTKSPMLKSMVLNPLDSINAEDSLRISEEICRFGRASSQVKISSLCPEMEVNFQRSFP